MILYPAVDILDGRVVRLRQGDYGDTTVYGDDPVVVAQSFAEAGASWIHVVDLDAARSGEPVNRAVIGRMCDAVRGRAVVQTGGGVRTVDDARALLDEGVARVVMGSAALASPELVERVSSIVEVAVGLDHRQGSLAAHGWTVTSDLRVADALGRFPTAAAFIITDISRDGMLTGPDCDGLAVAVGSTSVPVIASGGVGTLADLEALARISGLGGVIVGKALYEGRFTVAEALTIVRGRAS